MLFPIILYGIAYFGFLFADRLSAGSAVAWSSGLPFGVDPLYKKAMDLALLAFLLGTIVVEYLSDLFIRFWWSRVSSAQQTTTYCDQPNSAEKILPRGSTRGDQFFRDPTYGMSLSSISNGTSWIACAL